MNEMDVIGTMDTARATELFPAEGLPSEAPLSFRFLVLGSLACCSGRRWAPQARPMASATCANHPTKAATHRCKKCDKGLCPLCVQITDLGQFCSRECYEAVQEFQKMVMAGRAPSRGGLSAAMIFKTFVFGGLALGAAYGVGYWQFGTTDPMVMLSKVWDQAKYLIQLVFA